MANRHPGSSYRENTGPSNPPQSVNQSWQRTGATSQPLHSTGMYYATTLPNSFCHGAPVQRDYLGRLYCWQCGGVQGSSHQTGFTSSGAQSAVIQGPYGPQVSSPYIPRQHPAAGQVPRLTEIGNPVQGSSPMVDGANAYPGSGNDYPSRTEELWPPSTRTQPGYPTGLVERGRYNQSRPVEAGEIDTIIASVASESGPHFCNICGKKFGGDYSKGNLSRHKRQKHGDGEQNFHCKVAGCVKFFKRSDALLKHNRRSHPELGLNPPLPRR